MSKTIKTFGKGGRKGPPQPATVGPPNPELNAAKSTAANYRSAITTVIILGIVLAISTGLNWIASQNTGFKEPMDMSLRDPDAMRLGTGDGDSDRDGVPDLIYYPSPDLSSQDQNFCKGIGQSESCDNRPLHPIYESMRLLGTPIPDKQKQRKYTDKQTERRFKWLFDW